MSRCLLTGSDADGDAFESTTTYGFYVGKAQATRESKEASVERKSVRPSKVLKLHD